jgi:DNA sulfur modification protein DndE
MTKVKQHSKKSISGATESVFDFALQRIPFSVSIDAKMRTLRGRTGVTPNILARVGFCLSLEETGVPADPFISEGEGRVINRGTLLGEHDAVYVALLRTWIGKNLDSHSIDQERFNALFVAHMNRGFELISSRIRTLSDLGNLLGKKKAA